MGAASGRVYERAGLPQGHPWGWVMELREKLPMDGESMLLICVTNLARGKKSEMLQRWSGVAQKN